MSMVFLTNNEFDTTTQATVDSANTTTVIRACDRNVKTTWTTAGYNSNTSTIFSIALDTPVSISKIFLQNHNLKQFQIFYNSATANAFTPAISETTNSATSSYFDIATVTVATVQIQCDVAMTAQTEKQIGEIYIGDLLLNLERNPNAASYKPIIKKDMVIHRMPNEGVSVFVGGTKFKGEISWKFLSNSFTSQLQTLYETNTSFYFVPFPSASEWDGRAYQVLWTNEFDFKYSDNNFSAGQGGKIVLEETA